MVKRDVLPVMGRPMIAVFIGRNDFYRGTSTWLRTCSTTPISGLLMHPGEDGEEGRLACHGQADDRGFHREERFLQGYFHLAEDLFDDVLAHVGAALHQGGAGIDDDAVGE